MDEHHTISASDPLGERRAEDRDGLGRAEWVDAAALGELLKSDDRAARALLDLHRQRHAEALAEGWPH